MLLQTTPSLWGYDIALEHKPSLYCAYLPDNDSNLESTDSSRPQRVCSALQGWTIRQNQLCNCNCNFQRYSCELIPPLDLLMRKKRRSYFSGGRIGIAQATCFRLVFFTVMYCGKGTMIGSFSMVPKCYSRIMSLYVWLNIRGTMEFESGQSGLGLSCLVFEDHSESNDEELISPTKGTRRVRRLEIILK